MGAASLVTMLLASWYLVVPSLIVAYLLNNRYYGGLSRTPGPFAASLSPIPRMWNVYKGKSHLYDYVMHKKYGPLVRLAPNTFSLSDGAEIDQIYGVSTKFYKSRFFDPVRFYDDEGLVPDPLVLTDKKMHLRMKRSGGSAYSLSGLSLVEGHVDNMLEKLSRLLRTTYLEGGISCPMGDLAIWFALDAVSSITYGKDMGLLDGTGNRGMLDAAASSLVYLSVIGQQPWLHKILLGNRYVAKLWKRCADNTFIEAIMGVAMAETAAGIETLDNGIEKENTFLSHLLTSQRKNPASVTDREISTHTFGNITAGSDTTAIALRSTIINILTHRETYDKLCEEVRSNLTLPVTWAASSKLPYLKAIIQEAIRLQPSVSMILPRTVPDGGATICGYYLPAGAEVGINPYILHRDEHIFPEPAAFKPERWMTADKEQLALMTRNFFAFGGGSHTCSGRHVSLLEVTKFVPTLLLNFDMKLAVPATSIGVQNYWLASQTGLVVSLTERKLT